MRAGEVGLLLENIREQLPKRCYSVSERRKQRNRQGGVAKRMIYILLEHHNKQSIAMLHKVVLSGWKAL